MADFESDSSFNTSSDIVGKKLTDLKVQELKTELERRGKDKNGLKPALVERLSQVSRQQIDKSQIKYGLSQSAGFGRGGP